MGAVELQLAALGAVELAISVGCGGIGAALGAVELAQRWVRWNWRSVGCGRIGAALGAVELIFMLAVVRASQASPSQRHSPSDQLTMDFCDTVLLLEICTDEASNFK